MHVMHIIDSLHGGGAETSLVEMLPGLKSRGVRTTIVTLLSDDGALDNQLASLRVAPIRMRHRDPVGLTLELRNLIYSMRPDVIHTTLFRANVLGRIAARTVGTPVITTLANQDYGPEHRANSRFGSWSVRMIHSADLLTVPLTTRFHAISGNVAEVMARRLRIPEERIRVVYRGRDPKRLGVYTLERRLRTRATFSIDAQASVVLSVGRLDRQKGVDITVDAFRQLLNEMPDAVLLIAGRPGNASAIVRAKAQGCPAIRFLGHRTDIPDLMCAADVLSFSSRWEGLGGTVIEAMALRLAIVGSDIPPVVETIGDVDWPLVPPDNVQALAQALSNALKAGPETEARKDGGEERFHRVFTADAAADGMAQLYNEMLWDNRRDG
jgi:glycosyltransferase involved in cell wall biosynthesis